jgi:hypothetical protein
VLVDLPDGRIIARFGANQELLERLRLGHIAEERRENGW